MSMRLFAGAVMLMATVGAVNGGFKLGQLSTRSFDYASATEQSRQAFLKDEADTIGRSLRRGLISPSGVGPTLHLANVELDTRVPEILYVINVSGPARVSDRFDAIERQMLSTSCPKYSETALGKNRVRVVLAFMQKNRELERIVISQKSCRNFV